MVARDDLTKPLPKTDGRLFAFVRIRGRCQIAPHKLATAVTGSRSTRDQPGSERTHRELRLNPTMSLLAPIICDNGTGFSKVGCVEFGSTRGDVLI